MSTLPRILVIDDVYGRMRDGRNRDRESFCVRLGLQDVTGDGTPEEINHPVAEVVFLRGQVEEEGQVQNDLEGTLGQVRSGWAEWPRWALLLLDLHFKTGRIASGGEPVGSEHDRDPAHYFGLTILDHLWQDPSLRNIPVVLLSAMERNEIEARFAERGVLDFVDKNELDRDSLWGLLKQQGLIKDREIIGHALSLLQCLRAARRRAMQGDDNILILGETGTGKELLAEYVHKWSRRPGRYETLFTQGVPETLIEDKLFGHVKGAFTDAKSDEAGAADLANQGTLFIDEFGDIPATIQNKLLRLLDKNVREAQRLGSREVQKLDLQVVMATNRLDILTASGFRNDLLSRAKVRNPVVLPPLRERLEDIPLLVNHFVRKFEKAFEAK
ncbi:MAG: sigma 54-interacting transcriptional regulator, partial [Verrucomicrobiota bacterium]